MATVTHDVLDRTEEVAATLDVHDSGMAVVNVPGSDPLRFESVHAAVTRIHEAGGTVPDLDDDDE